jgi:hypothetical protein
MKNKFEKVTTAGPKTGALSAPAAKPPYVFKFNVNSIIRLWIFVAVIVTVLHYAIHQSIMAGVVEFVLGGLGYTWFLLMMAKPHLIEKINSRIPEEVEQGGFIHKSSGIRLGIGIGLEYDD